jgi:anti-sigma factor RsiW
MSNCDKSEALHDYAFDELSAGERLEMERHIPACTNCSAELDQLRLTTAALRLLPDREIPQRIAFVSDKIFQPSPFARFFKSAWTGFASAAVMATALVFTALHRPPVEVRTIIQTAPGVDISGQISEAVNKAVQQVRAEDAEVTKAALAEAETKHEREHRMLMIAVEQSLEVMQKRLGTATELASLEAPRNGGGQ